MVRRTVRYSAQGNGSRRIGEDEHGKYEKEQMEFFSEFRCYRSICHSGDPDHINICRGYLALCVSWLEEVQTSCMVWITFAAAGAAFRNGNHVAIEMIVDLMPEKVQKVMEIMIAVIVVVILGFLFVQTIPYLKIFLESGRSTSMLHIPYIVVYGISLFSYVDMVISFIYSILHGVKSEAKEAAGSDE